MNVKKMASVLNLTFCRILYPPSSISSSVYLAAQEPTAAFLNVSFSTCRVYLLLVNNIYVYSSINPFKPRILFVGHTLTVQTHTRCRRIWLLISFHCLLTEFSIKVEIKLKNASKQTCNVSLSLSYWYPGSGVVLDCIDS